MITVIRQRINTDQMVSMLFLLSLTVLNVFDFITTNILVKRAGYEVEVNPLLYHLMITFDTTEVIMWAKVIGLGYIWFLFFYMLTTDHPALYNKVINMRNALVLTTIFYFSVVCWNSFLCFG